MTDQQPLAPMRQESGTVTGPLVVAIERTWAAIQGRHPDVPDVVLPLGNGSARPGQLTLGHFHDGKWATGDNARLPELFLGGEGLARASRAVLGTLLHEATHGVAATRGIKDTSRQGRYHNTRFRNLATELGITVERDPAIGWSVTTVPDTTAQQYADQIAALDAAIKAHRLDDVHGPGRTTSDNGLVATCECDPPRKIRLSRSAYDSGAITCGVCEAEFAARDTDRSAEAKRDGPALASEVARSTTARERRHGVMDYEQARSLEQAVRDAVEARESAHQHVADLVLARLTTLIDAEHDEQHAAHAAAAQVTAETTARPEHVDRDRRKRATAGGRPLIDAEQEVRVFTARVTDQDIDAATSTAERDTLLDLAARQQAIVALRDRFYADTARDTADLYVECREAYGLNPAQARAAAWIEVVEGTRAERDTARYRLDDAAELRRSVGTSAAGHRGDLDQREANVRHEQARDVEQHASKSELSPHIANGTRSRADARPHTDDTRRLADALLHDEERSRPQVADDPVLHQHNAVTTSPAAHPSRPRRAHITGAAEADQDGDPVLRARRAVDHLVARRREIEQQQQAEGAHTAQITRWRHDDPHARDVDRSSARADRGAIDDLGAVR
jgi:hypothetical protein